MGFTQKLCNWFSLSPTKKIVRKTKLIAGFSLVSILPSVNIVPTVFFRTRSHKGKKRGKEEEATVASPTEKGEILNGKKREKREGD